MCSFARQTDSDRLRSSSVHNKCFDIDTLGRVDAETKDQK